MMADTDWISAHLFYHDDPSTLLTSCITPLVKELFAEKLLRKYFFIRYWLGGPHIRFRALPENERYRGEIQKRIERAAQHFFQEHPSTAELDRSSYDEFSKYHSYSEYGADVRVPLYANNSLHYIQYEPEYEHYGGVEAMEQVQTHFMESSDIVLDFLTHNPSLNQRMVQGTAATFATALLEYTDIVQLQKLFEEHFHFWDRIPPPQQEKVLQLFQKQYESQRRDSARLVASVLQLTRLDRARLERTTVPIERWYFSVQRLYQVLSEMEHKGRLQVMYHHMRSSVPLSILFRCIHMHNNRMGVPISKESYQLYLLLQRLNELVDELLPA